MRTVRNNPYKDDVDFATLALQSPEFAKYLKPNNQLDFSDPDALRQLTKSLLQRDFNLKVDIPRNRLCPPVPNRPKWNFIGIDIDNDNIRTSQESVAANELESRIRIVKTDPSDSLISLEKLEVEALDFTMCNPPFYTSREELISSAQAKERPPFSSCTGADVEMVTEGGEVAFVSRMIEDSLRLREKVRWYTSMLGKLSSVSVLVEKLLECGNHNYAVTEFVQGSKTRRWAIAWSWGDLRPTVEMARSITKFPKNLLPFPSEYVFDLTTGSIDDAGQQLDAEITSLPIKWFWRKNLATGAGFAMENVWSRQARRKMKSSEGAMQSIEVDESQAALGFKVHLRKEGIEENGVRISIRWLKGTDTVLFESFCEP
ncbi:hypothetical protein BBP40_006763 [Aspergillus hancockii]|nr:hypothetical protein BBP40_006763 [Aspergillus hancockii]